jgi:NNP family nitrate/nitrite transporter-like MFS transporter
MAVFLPKLLRDWFDISLTNAGLRAAGFTVVATFARPVGGYLSDRIGATTVLIVVFVGAGIDAAWLAFVSGDPTWTPVTIACLTLAGFLGLGNGAVFKMVPHDFPEATGAATGIVGAAGGLGGFFPPVVMGIVKDHFDTYALGFVGLLLFTVICLVVALTMRRAARMPRGVAA